MHIYKKSNYISRSNLFYDMHARAYSNKYIDIIERLL